MNWRFTPLCLRIVRELIKNMNPWALPPLALPMTQMRGPGEVAPRPGQCSDLRKVTGSKAGKLLVKGPERPRRVWMLPWKPRNNPMVLKPRSEVEEQYSRKSREEE